MSDIAEIFAQLEMGYDPDNVYFQVISAVLEAGQPLKLPSRLELILAQPKNELMIHFPVQMDDGHFRLFKGYRVQHNNVLGPYKGGIRFHAKDLPPSLLNSMGDRWRHKVENQKILDEQNK